MTRRVPRVKLTRDVIMFGLGAWAFIYEVLTGGDRANVLFLAGALMGVAAYLRAMTAAENAEGEIRKEIEDDLKDNEQYS